MRAASFIAHYIITEKKKTKSQLLLYKIIQNIFRNIDVEYNYKGFEWLKTNTNRRQEIDIFVPKIKLAIEYDGEQHFMPINFGGVSNKKSEEEFKLTKARDKNKNKLIKKHKTEINYFIRIPYNTKIDEENINNILTSNGININDYNK